MAKNETETSRPETSRPAPKLIVAFEYNGTLYPSFQAAEDARTEDELVDLLVPKDWPVFRGKDTDYAGAIKGVIKNAEKVHGILSRHLDAAKITMRERE